MPREQGLAKKMHHLNPIASFFAGFEALKVHITQIAEERKGLAGF